MTPAPGIVHEPVLFFHGKVPGVTAYAAASRPHREEGPGVLRA